MTKNSPIAFDGGAHVVAALPCGPVRALNVIFNPLTAQAEVQVVSLTGGAFSLARSHAVVLDGELCVAGSRLARFDTILTGVNESLVEGHGRVATINVAAP